MLLISYAVVGVVCVCFFYTGNSSCCSVFILGKQIFFFGCIGSVNRYVFVLFDDLRCFVSCKIHFNRLRCRDLICFAIVCDRCCTFGCHRLQGRIFITVFDVVVFCYRNHQVAVLLGDHVFCDIEFRCYVCISGRITDTDNVIAIFHHVSCFVGIVRSHFFRIKTDRKDLRLARCQFVCLGVAGQFLIWLVQFTVRSWEINFCYFFTGYGTSIFYLNLYGYFIFVCFYRFCWHRKTCVRSAVTKRIRDIHTKRIIITISYENIIVI